MKSLVLAAASAVALFAAAPAFSADLPEYAAPIEVAVPSFTWTGFYVGATAGYTFGDRNIKTRGNTPLTRDNVAFGRRAGNLGIDPEGFAIGGTVGYNQQFDAFVVGIEADISYTDVDDSQRYSAPSGPGTSINSRYKQEMEYFGTVRGRVGYAFDRFLVFGAGGLAYGKVKTEARFFNNNAPMAPNSGLLGYRGGDSSTEVGYTVGGGVEYAVTDNITVKGEYLYYDLGDTSFRVRATATSPGGSYTSKSENDGHLIRAGVNYKF